MLTTGQAKREGHRPSPTNTHIRVCKIQAFSSFQVEGEVVVIGRNMGAHIGAPLREIKVVGKIDRGRVLLRCRGCARADKPDHI